MFLRIACVGGGPGGLFFATLVKQADPAAEVTVFERNRADDTFGFGVVFSDATLAGIHAADPVLREALDEHGLHWDDIEVRLQGRADPRAAATAWPRSSARRCSRSCRSGRSRPGRDLRFSTEVDLEPTSADYDLVVAADGANSPDPRARSPTSFGAVRRDGDGEVHLVRHRPTCSTG